MFLSGLDRTKDLIIWAKIGLRGPLKKLGFRQTHLLKYKSFILKPRLLGLPV